MSKKPNLTATQRLMRQLSYDNPAESNPWLTPGEAAYHFVQAGLLPVGNAETAISEPPSLSSRAETIAARRAVAMVAAATAATANPVRKGRAKATPAPPSTLKSSLAQKNRKGSDAKKKLRFETEVDSDHTVTDTSGDEEEEEEKKKAAPKKKRKKPAGKKRQKPARKRGKKAPAAPSKPASNEEEGEEKEEEEEEEQEETKGSDIAERELTPKKPPRPESEPEVIAEEQEDELTAPVPVSDVGDSDSAPFEPDESSDSGSDSDTEMGSDSEVSFKKKKQKKQEKSKRMDSVSPAKKKKGKARVVNPVKYTEFEKQRSYLRRIKNEFYAGGSLGEQLYASFTEERKDLTTMEWAVKHQADVLAEIKLQARIAEAADWCSFCWQCTFCRFVNSNVNSTEDDRCADCSRSATEQDEEKESDDEEPAVVSLEQQRECQLRFAIDALEEVMVLRDGCSSRRIDTAAEIYREFMQYNCLMQEDRAIEHVDTQRLVLEELMVTARHACLTNKPPHWLDVAFVCWHCKFVQRSGSETCCWCKTRMAGFDKERRREASPPPPATPRVEEEEEEEEPEEEEGAPEEPVVLSAAEIAAQVLETLMVDAPENKPYLLGAARKVYTSFMRYTNSRIKDDRRWGRVDKQNRFLKSLPPTSHWLEVAASCPKCFFTQSKTAKSCCWCETSMPDEMDCEDEYNREASPAASSSTHQTPRGGSESDSQNGDDSGEDGDGEDEEEDEEDEEDGEERGERILDRMSINLGALMMMMIDREEVEARASDDDDDHEEEEEGYSFAESYEDPVEEPEEEPEEKPKPKLSGKEEAPPAADTAAVKDPNRERINAMRARMGIKPLPLPVDPSSKPTPMEED